MDIQNPDLTKAKALLAKGHTCVLCKGEDTVFSDKAGIAPMLGFLAEGLELKGYSAADKIVGKAAAFLFVLAGVKTLHANVLSKEALPVLNEHDVTVTYDQLVEGIINREGTGSCPMELTVREFSDPTQAHAALVKKIAELRRGK